MKTRTPCFAITLIISTLAASGAINTWQNDFDGDGRSDLAVYHPQTGSWYVRQSSDGALMGNGPIFWGWSSTVPAPGDFDGDGRTDIAVFESTFSEWFIRLSSTTSLMTGQAILLGPIYGYAAPGDYDGDGKTDPASWADGYFAVLKSGGTSVEWIAWGEPGDFPVPDDYDGDGSTDLAVYSVTGNGTTWKILRSSDGQTNIVTLGSINERPVAADYNGDALADPEIYDYFTAEWRGNVSFAESSFGWSESIPVPGDYDGDGVADRAVFYPAAGQWYVRLTGNNTMMEGGPIQWGWSEAIPALWFPYIPSPNPQVVGYWSGVIRSRGRIYSFAMNFPIEQPGSVLFTNSDGCEYLADGAAIFGLEGDAYFSLVQSRNNLRGTITNPPGFAPGVYAVKLFRTR